MNLTTIILIVVAVIFSLLDTVFARKIKVLDKKEEFTEEDEKLKSKYTVIRGFSILVIFVIIAVFAFFIL